MTSAQNLKNAFLAGQLTRKQFVVQGLTLGLSMASISTFLTAHSAAAEAGHANTDAILRGQEPAMAESQTLVMNNDVDILSLDPLQTAATASVKVMSLVHDSVGFLDQDLNIQPHLAESWEVSDDGLIYTYTFRQDVVSHLGDPFSADDVIFSLDRIFGDEVADNPVRDRIEMIDSYQKVDDYTVEITLQYPFAPFPSAFGIQFLYSQAGMEGMTTEEFGSNPVGFGPFRFVEWRPNEHVRLEGFEDYWLTTPNIESIDVRPIPEASVAVANILSGDLDIVTNVTGPILEQLQSADDVDVLTEPGLDYSFAAFRMLEPPFTDERFRQAVYMATDFDGLIGAILPADLGERAYNTVPPGLWPRDDAFMEELRNIAPQQDQDQARALFDELIDEGVMPEDYQIRVAVRIDPINSPIAEAMVTNLNEIDINAELLVVENATYGDEVLRGDQNVIYFSGTTPDYPDPNDNVRWLFGGAGSHADFLNLTEFEEFPEWRDQLETAMRSQDQEERAEIYRDIIRTMMSLYVHIPLVHTNVVMAKRDQVQELDATPLPQWNIVTPWSNVYLSE